MIHPQHQRTQMLIGAEHLHRLQQCKIAVCGLGGVGSYAAEALARSGIGRLLLIDHDIISISNCNRQLPALHSTIGKEKTAVMQQRIQDIDPAIQVEAHSLFLTQNTEPALFHGCHYIVDAVDNVTAKLRLAQLASTLEIPIISAMGCGNKLDPTLLQVTDLYQTNTCPLCRVMRRECKKRNIPSLKVVYSTETPYKPKSQAAETASPPASMIFVPASAGLMMAAEVVKDLLT